MHHNSASTDPFQILSNILIWSILLHYTELLLAITVLESCLDSVRDIIASINTITSKDEDTEIQETNNANDTNKANDADKSSNHSCVYTTPATSNCFRKSFLIRDVCNIYEIVFDDGILKICHTLTLIWMLPIHAYPLGTSDLNFLRNLLVGQPSMAK